MKPTKSLLDPNPKTQHEYVHSTKTDLRATFAKWRAEQAKAQPEKQIRRIR